MIVPIPVGGKFSTKLLQVVSDAVGKMYEPTAIRKKADADAYAIRTIEEAKTYSLIKNKKAEIGILNRIEQRLLNKEIKRQKNIENISRIAVTQEVEEKDVSDDPLNADWVTRFFNIAQDISDEEMQNLWGRILAGEVAKPKSYSLRTLELLKNLSKEEAEIFSKFGNFAIHTQDSAFLLDFHVGDVDEEFWSEKYKIEFGDKLLLAELGLIVLNTLSLGTNKEDKEDHYRHGNYGIVIQKDNMNTEYEIPVTTFTTIGIELLKLINVNFNYEYIKFFASKIKTTGIKIVYGELDGVDDRGKVKLKNQKDMLQ